MGFTENQKKVIEYGKGSLLVEAGPGSGKTTVLVERIKHLIKTRQEEGEDVDPESFLVITFTIKAADNLKYKLRKELPTEFVSKMQISTIHSFCFEYLKSLKEGSSKKYETLTLIDDDASERKTLLIKKHKRRLGFKDYSTIFDFHIQDILSKFSEYTSFNVDSDKLKESISDSRKISQDYKNFVDSMDYFSKKRIDDHDKPIKSGIDRIKRQLKNEDDEDVIKEKQEEIKELEKELFSKSWYNARFLQIIEAYGAYKDLLEEYHYVDFNTLQLKTLEELKINPETRFKTIFIDEFQDTDPLQFRIFQELRKTCDYFTAVGDVDQHIYAFRSSFNDFFDELINLEGLEPLPLCVNFRSTEDIVNLTEKFIVPQRKESSRKKMMSNNDDYTNPNFLIENSGSAEEAENIFEIIKYLKENDLINDYSDVAVLYRKHSDDTLTYLVDKFNQNDIAFSIKGQKDLSCRPEVKSMIALMWYISRDTSVGKIPSKDELKELNLKSFCGEYYETPLFSLDDSTKEYLCEIQDDYYETVIANEYDVAGKKGVIHRVKDRETQDTLIEMFRDLHLPTIDMEKITNPKDKEFFEKLEKIRDNISSDKKPSILEVFYQLIGLSNIYEHELSYIEIANLAILTQSISNYEAFISDTNFKGARFFLSDAVKNYDSYQKEGNGVQMMTIHAAKGLEFPVTIISSLENDKFPMINKDPERVKDNVFPNDTYYTPNECLRYKTILIKDENGGWKEKPLSIEEENILNDEEEDRVLYVAMTRAKDLLILSTIGEVPDQINGIRENTIPFSFDELANVKIESEDKKEEEYVDNLEQLEEPVVLNYSKYTKYISCPFKYDLSYNLGFRRSGMKAANRGSVFHEIMENLNMKLKDGEIVSREELAKTTYEAYNSMFDIEKAYSSSRDDLSEEEEEKIKEYEQFRKNVEDYYFKYSVNRDILEAELDFELFRENYILNGAIDLIYRDSDGELVVLDYKYSKYKPEHIGGYIKQSYIYASALREIPEYQTKIKKAIIHFVLGKDDSDEDYQYEVIIDESKMDEEKVKLNEVANKIYAEEYEKEPEKAEDCANCSYRYFCKPDEFAEELYKDFNL